MRTIRKLVLSCILPAAVLAACYDAGDRTVGPNTPRQRTGGANATAGCSATISELNTLAHAVFGEGSPSVNSVLGKLDNLRKKVENGDIVGAQDQANNIVRFVRDKAEEGQLAGSREVIDQFIAKVLCYAGLPPNTFLILPSDAPQVKTADDGASGISLEANTVTVPTLLTFSPLDPNGPSPLDTKLDQYPAYVNITVSSGITKPAIVAVCPAVSVPLEVQSRLRLGHQRTSGFEITPAADGGFLDCSIETASSSLPGWLSAIASVFSPKVLHAAPRVTGGIGGSVTEFSPFGAVDPEVSLKSGGIGGSATEFGTGSTTPVTQPVPAPRRRWFGRVAEGGMRPVARPLALAQSECTDMSAIVGTAVDCKPVVTVTTARGTVLSNVPVTWTITQGGGSIAANDLTTSVCGEFASGQGTLTGADGRTSVCWILGMDAGENRVVATPGVGGDAPAGVTFAPSGTQFTATGLRITPTVTATGGDYVFDYTPRPGAGSCSHGLTPALTYSSGTVPVNAGSYTLTVTCGAGTTSYHTVTATAAITIAKVAATATSGSATIEFGDPVPTIPCTVSGLLAADAGSVTCTTSIPTSPLAGVYPATPVLSPTDPLNYVVTLFPGTFRVIGYTQAGCFSAPIYNVMPATKSAQRKGSTLPVKCTLTRADGSPVTTAVGDLVVVDRGPSGTADPVVAFSGTNVFKYSRGGNYAYGLDTSPATFRIGHYYFVTATWNDGSRTQGWFLLK